MNRVVLFPGSALFSALVVVSALAASGCGAFGETETESETEADPFDTGDDDGTPELIVRIVVDPDAPRLDNFGQPATMPEGHAGQSPTFHAIGAHYLELTPHPFTPLMGGEIVFETPHTDAGGAPAVEFDTMPVVAPGELFVSVPLSEVAPGSYPYMRMAVSYQEYDLDFRAEVGGQNLDLTGRLASFVEDVTYVRTLELDGETLELNENKEQGYWAFNIPLYGIVEGQAPVGATTVPNPLDETSPIPVNSCVVTGVFDETLEIIGNETEDIIVTITLSSNDSFEWVDGNGNGVYEPLLNEFPVDMGVRGMTISVD